MRLPADRLEHETQVAAHAGADRTNHVARHAAFAGDVAGRGNEDAVVVDSLSHGVHASRCGARSRAGELSKTVRAAIGRR